MTEYNRLGKMCHIKVYVFTLLDVEIPRHQRFPTFSEGFLHGMTWQRMSHVEITNIPEGHTHNKATPLITKQSINGLSKPPMRAEPQRNTYLSMVHLPNIISTLTQSCL